MLEDLARNSRAVGLVMGAKVVIADWKMPALTIEGVERNGGEAWARKVDVRDATHLDSLVKRNHR